MVVKCEKWQYLHVLQVNRNQDTSSRAQNTSGSRGGAPGARPHPNGRGPMIFYAKKR